MIEVSKCLMDRRVEITQLSGDKSTPDITKLEGVIRAINEDDFALYFLVELSSGSLTEEKATSVRLI